MKIHKMRAESCPLLGIGLGSPNWESADKPLDYSQLLKIKLLKFYIPIYKVLE